MMATDTTTAPTSAEPTALEPRRVLIFTDNEQRIVLEALRIAQADAEAQGIDLVPASINLLHSRIAHGDEYADPIDELDRRTLTKRRLEQEVKRHGRRIDALNNDVVDELVARGERKITRDDTGSTLSILRNVWAKISANQAEDLSDEEKAANKAAAAQVLERAGLGHFVKPDFNLNSVSAYFREQVNTYLEEQLALPKEQRRIRPVEDFIPDELRGVIELTDKPKISVTAES